MAVTQRSLPISMWGWGVLLVLSALLVINGLWLFFEVGSASVVEQDMGVRLSELQTAYPTVAAELERRGRTISFLLAGLGLLAFVVSWGGLQTGSLWAWNALWALILVLTAMAVMMLMGGRSDIGFFYLALVVVALVGQMLAGRSVRSS